MNEHALAAPALHLQRWFRRDVEAKLEDVIGGPARLKYVFLLACVLALSAADTATVGATASQLEKALHIGNTEVGLLATVSTGVGAVATLPLGVLTDRVNRTRLLAGAIVVWSLALVVSGASTSYLMLLIARLALGAVVATAGPAVASLTGDLFPASERGRIYGFVLTGELAGAGIGFAMSGNVAAALSWRFAFWLLAIPGAVLAVAIWRLFPEPARGGQSRLQLGDEQMRSARQVRDEGEDPDMKPEDQPGSAAAPAVEDSEVAREVAKQDIRPHQALVLHDDPTGRSLWWAVKYVLSIPSNRLLILASALGYFFFAGLRTFAVIFLRGRFGLGQGTASTLLVVIGLGAIVGVLVTGRLGDHLISRHHISARPVVSGVAFIVAAALFLPGMLTTSLLVAAPLFFLAASALGGANPPLDAARLDLVHSRLWGRAESVRTVLRSSLEAIAPLLFGYVSSSFGGAGGGLGHPTGNSAKSAAGLDTTFLIMLIPLLAAGLLLAFRARHTYPSDVATAIASEQTTGSPTPRLGTRAD